MARWFIQRIRIYLTILCSCKSVARYDAENTQKILYLFHCNYTEHAIIHLHVADKIWCILNRALAPYLLSILHRFHRSFCYADASHYCGLLFHIERAVTAFKVK